MFSSSDAMLNDTGTSAKVEEVIIGVLLPLAWATVGARFYVRGKLTRSLGWDDFSMLLTLTLFTHYCAFILVIIDRGGFRESPLADTLPRTINFILTAEVIYIMTTIFLRVSLALFFLRIVTQKWHRLVFHFCLAITTAAGVAYVFIAIFQCGMPTRLVENVLGGKCAHNNLTNGFGYFYSTLNIVSDWTFVVVAIIMLKGTAMDKRAKISVGVLMSLGALGSVSSIVRMWYIEGSVIADPDFFKNAADLGIWSTIEPGLGIFAGSLATLRPLFRSIITFTRRNMTFSHTRSPLPADSRRDNGYQRSDDIRMGASIRSHDQDLKPRDRDQYGTSISIQANGTRDKSRTPIDNGGIMVTRTIDIEANPSSMHQSTTSQNKPIWWSDTRYQESSRSDPTPLPEISPSSPIGSLEQLKRSSYQNQSLGNVDMPQNISHARYDLTASVRPETNHTDGAPRGELHPGYPPPSHFMPFV